MLAGCSSMRQPSEGQQAPALHYALAPQPPHAMCCTVRNKALGKALPASQ